MSDNINNNEQNRDMNDSQDVPNQANDLVAEEPINAEDLNPNDEGGDVVSITTTSNQASISLRPPHDPGRVRVHINSLEPTPRFPVDPWSCKPSGQFRCGICLIEINHLENTRSTTCGHIYCDSCLQQALRENGYCPICGKSQEYESSIRLFWCGHSP
ncbi:GL24030 [Drosophila persimilis]|uniref:GL24030 n=1 Tax=Drosophila persimilis TaxID=7234 RepID=B4G344_DROPE|nr:GL24030 [Drosophila persimilis]